MGSVIVTVRYKQCLRHTGKIANMFSRNIHMHVRQRSLKSNSKQNSKSFLSECYKAILHGRTRVVFV